MTRKMMTYEDAIDATFQHTEPCSDCPWDRSALPGWLGSLTADEWLQAAHGETLLGCHTMAGAQCAGGAIYRANLCKIPRDPSLLRLPSDRETVFDSPREFREHHEVERDAA